MKHIKYLIIVILSIGLFVGCEEDFEDPVLTFEGGLDLTELTTGEYEAVLSNDIAENTFATFTWTEAQYNVATTNEYAIEVDTAGNNFANAVTVAKISDTTSLDVTVFKFNLALTASLGIPPFTTPTVEVRVASIVGEGSPNRSYSNSFDMTVTTYDPPFEPEKLYIFDSEDESVGYILPVTADDADDGLYEGYIYFAEATEIQFGDQTRQTILGNDGNAGPDDDVDLNHDLFEDQGYIAVDSGYYQVTVNTYDNTFDMYVTDWGIIGSALPDGWDSDIDMNFDPETELWTITQTVADGEMKFRPNDTWDPLNYGDGSEEEAADGIPDEYGTNIQISAGTYKIVLDLNEYPYSYSIESAE